MTNDEEAFLSKFLRRPEDPRPAYAFQSDNLVEEMEKVPLFMTKQPDPNGPGNVVLDALQALLYEGSPEEIATNFKERGNEAYLAGQHNDALQFYSRGLEQIECGDGQLMATLHLNRAAVQMHLQNYRMAIGDCEAALEILAALPIELMVEGQIVKAHVRAAKALHAVKRHSEALNHLDRANELHPETPTAIQDLLGSVKSALQEDLMRKQVQAKEEKVMNRIRALLRRRNVSHVAGCERDLLALIAPTGDLPDLGTVRFVSLSAIHLQWPVILFYPPYGQLDFIAGWDERTTFAAQLATVFNQPAVWDSDGIYAQTKDLHVFYNPPTTRTLYRMGQERRLETLIGSVIREIDSGILAFYILPPSRLESFLSKFEVPNLEYM